MTITWRVLPAVLLAVAALTPAGQATAASNTHCTYYKWNATTDRWERVKTLQPKDRYEADHQQGVDYDCPYCWGDLGPVTQLLGTQLNPDDLIAQVGPPLEPVTGPVHSVTDPVHDLVEDTVAALGLGNPFGPPPPCPPVPPEWDAV